MYAHWFDDGAKKADAATVRVAISAMAVQVVNRRRIAVVPPSRDVSRESLKADFEA